MSDHDEEQTLMIQRAIFGKQVEVFMTSDIGKYLVARAQEEKAIAQDDFKKVLCSDVGAVQEIQNRILVADSIVGWLQDAVGDGLQALNIIEDRT